MGRLRGRNHTFPAAGGVRGAAPVTFGYAPIDAQHITVDDMNGPHYYLLRLIVSFASRDTEVLWETGRSRKFPASIRQAAGKKLAILDAAVDLSELLVPPGNRLERLRGDRGGQYSIRINDQYRICFVWRNQNAHLVEILDYH
jgi:toxin HigB-1